MMNQPKRKHRTSKQIDHLNGEQLIQLIKDFSKVYGIPLDKITLNRDYDDHFCSVALEGFSDETNEELKSRLLAEKKQEEDIRDAKLRQFNRLKKELNL